MDLTQKIISDIRSAAKAYDVETTDIENRIRLGQEFDSLTDMLSDGQLKQVAKMLRRAC